MNPMNAFDAHSPSTTASAFESSAIAALRPLPETRGARVVVLAPTALPAPVPEGFIDVDDLIATEQPDPRVTEALAEGRRVVASHFYASGRPSLASFRLQKGWSQKQLAERAQTSQPYIARLENGGVDPQVGTLRRIAVALGVSVATLIEALPERS
jgi:DNA-binding XRE family transcriptional regulator